MLPHLPFQHTNAALPVIRIAVVGDSGVGKSHLIRKLCYTKPPPTHFFDFGVGLEACYHLHQPPPTLRNNSEHHNEHDYQHHPYSTTTTTTTTTTSTTTTTTTNAPTSHLTHHNDLNIPPPELFLIEFLDLPGHKRYLETRSTLFSDRIDGVLLLFDARNTRSNTSVPRWYQELSVLHQQRKCFTLTSHTPAVVQGNHYNFIFPLFMLGTLVDNLPPFNFGWIPDIPFTDLLFLDVNTIEQYVEIDQNEVGKDLHCEALLVQQKKRVLLELERDYQIAEQMGLEIEVDEEEEEFLNAQHVGSGGMYGGSGGGGASCSMQSLESGEFYHDNNGLSYDEAEAGRVGQRKGVVAMNRGYTTASSLNTSQYEMMNNSHNNNNNSSFRSGDHLPQSDPTPPREHPFLTFQALLAQFIDNIIIEKRRFGISGVYSSSSSSQPMYTTSDPTATTNTNAALSGAPRVDRMMGGNYRNHIALSHEMGSRDTDIF